MELDRRSLVLGATVFLCLISIPSFLEHYLYFMTGQVEEVVFKGRWDLVMLNVLGFLLFVIPLHFRRKADWKSFSIYSAFIVSLFVEMYGIPLTVYLSSTALFTASAPQTVWYSFSLLGESFWLTPWMLIGLGITVLGMIIVAVGWTTIYRTDEELVTTGVYSYSRHPQYIGIVLVALGWFIGWPTLLTTLLLPVLFYTYYMLSLKEEKEVSEQVGEEYGKYCEKVPRFV